METRLARVARKFAVDHGPYGFPFIPWVCTLGSYRDFSLFLTSGSVLRNWISEHLNSNMSEPCALEQDTEHLPRLRRHHFCGDNSRYR